jgi:hypothetical protein
MTQGLETIEGQPPAAEADATDPLVPDTPSEETEVLAVETEATSLEGTPEVSVESLQSDLAVLQKRYKDLQGQQVGRKRAADREAVMHDRIGALERTIQAWMTHQTSDATPDLRDQQLRADLKTIQEDSATAEVDSQWEDDLTRAKAALSEAIYADDGVTPVVDPASARLAEARRIWTAAQNDRNAIGLLETVQLAWRERLRIDRVNAMAPKQTKEEPAKGTKPGGRESLEMASMPGGGPAAAASATEINRAYGRGEIPWSEEVIAARRQLGF